VQLRNALVALAKGLRDSGIGRNEAKSKVAEVIRVELAKEVATTDAKFQPTVEAVTAEIIDKVYGPYTGSATVSAAPGTPATQPAAQPEAQPEMQTEAQLPGEKEGGKLPLALIGGAVVLVGVAAYFLRK